jgi:hypothetical protein
VNPKKLEEAKITTFILDGNNLPVTTRMKRILKENHQKLLGKQSQGAQNTTGSNEAAVATSTGRRQKSNLATGSTAGNPTGEFEPFPNSTDDEANLSKLLADPQHFETTMEGCKENPGLVSVDPNLWYLRYSYPMNIDSVLAARPDSLWPARFDVKRKPLVKWK